MKFLNNHIFSLQAYKVPEIEEGEIKLDAMENPYSFSGEVIEKLQSVISKLDFNS